MRPEIVSRIAALRTTPKGVLLPNPLVRLVEMFGPDSKTVEPFLAWSRQDITQALVAVLRELTVNPPINVQSAETHIQYGVTLGLQIATAVLEDPTVLFPGVFEPCDAPAMPISEYSNEPVRGEDEQ